MMKSTYGAPVQKISIADLLEKELQCQTLPTNGKLYPENPDRPYFISGVLRSVDVSPYHKIEIPDTTYGVPLGEFSVSGIISEQCEDHLSDHFGEDTFRLAFRYMAQDCLPTATNYKIENFVEFIHSQREGNYAAYLHLRAMLEDNKATIALEGKVRNSSPRLSLPHGMIVGVDTLRTRHG